MLADTGAHAVEPLDPLGGVSVADAKRRIGGRVALMGGVNTLTLAHGTPEEVKSRGDPQVPGRWAGRLYPGGRGHGAAGHAAGEPEGNGRCRPK